MTSQERGRETTQPWTDLPEAISWFKFELGSVVVGRIEKI